jgi:hypothetical protein
MARDRKNPQWKAEWDRLVGDHKYFRIKNWDRCQFLLPNGVPAGWIKDYCEKDFDCTDWTLMERWLMDALRRWRGRRGENILANLTAILGATNAPLTARARVPEALLTLIGRGFLVPCNESDRLLKKSREDKRREEKNRILLMNLKEKT